MLPFETRTHRHVYAIVVAVLKHNTVTCVLYQSILAVIVPLLRNIETAHPSSGPEV